MNLSMGAFAGGLAQGLTKQQELAQRQQEIDDSRGFRDRQLRMQEQEAADVQERRGREKMLRDESASLWASTYRPDSQEQVGETQADDGVGGVLKIPTMKTVRGVKPGDDRAVDSKWYTDHLELVAKYSGMTPEDMAKTTAQVDGLKRTAHGELLDKVMNGDKMALASMLKEAGDTDPTGAKYDFRPLDGVNEIVLSNGKKIDLKTWAAANATAAHYTRLKDMESTAQAAADKAATRGNVGATTEHTKAQTEELKASAPGKRRLVDSQAAFNEEGRGAAREDRNAARTAATDIKQQAADLARAKAVTGIDPSSPDGKGSDRDQIAFILDHASRLRASGAGGDVVSQAQQTWKKASDDFDENFKSATSGMSKADIKKKVGDLDAYKARKMRQALTSQMPGAAEDAAPGPAAAPAAARSKPTAAPAPAAAPLPGPAAAPVRTGNVGSSGDSVLNKVVADGKARAEAALVPAMRALQQAQAVLATVSRSGDPRSIAKYAQDVADAQAKVDAIRKS